MAQEVKILCVGDIHFKSSSLPQTSVFMERIKALLNKNKDLDFVVVLGDVLHNFNIYHQEPFNQAVEFLKILYERIPTFLLVGNHDYPNNSQFLTSKHAFNALKEWGENMIIVDDVIEHVVETEGEDEEFLFYFVPYVPPGKFEEALNLSDGLWENADCIFAHQEFKKCKMGPKLSEEGDEWDETYPTVVSGHIHESHWVGENIYYPGSSIQQDHREGENKHVCILTIRKNKDHETEIEIEEIDLGMRKKKIISMPLEEVENFNLKKYKNIDLKLELVGKNNDYARFQKTKSYRSLINKGVKIIFIHSFVASKNELSEMMAQNSVKYGSKYVEVLQGMISDSKSPSVQEAYKKIIMADN